MGLVSFKNAFGFFHAIRLKSVARNGKFVFLFVLLLSMNLLMDFAECVQFFRSRRTLHAYKSPPHFLVDTKARDQMFKVYWNSPTFQCKSHGILFDDLKSYGIRQNQEDLFRGDQISILYDPGNFPALLKDPNNEDFFYRNGGVPQEGSLKDHLDQFKQHLEQLIPNGAFNGMGVIDFESWRPIFRQNFGSLKPYKDVSYDIERKRHKLWPQSWVENEAQKRFEEAGTPYMKETLLAAKEARPLAKWGYYAYPYCFNMNGNNKNPDCPDNVKEENNRIQWLWEDSDALYPSVYISKNRLNPDERMQLIKGRMTEAKRVSARSETKPPIFPYFWYKYQDESDTFLTKDDLYNGFDVMKKSGVSGVIIWGSSNDVNSKEKCLQLKDYVKNVLGPVVREFVPRGTHKNFEDFEEVTETSSTEPDLPEFDFDIRK